MVTTRHSQRTVRQGLGVLPLSGTDSSAQAGVPSPYFHTPTMRKEAPDRDTKLSLKLMAVNHALIRGIDDGPSGQMYLTIYYEDGTSGAVVEVTTQAFSVVGITTRAAFIAAAENTATNYATAQGYSLTGGVVWSLPTDADINALIATALAALPSPHAVEGTTVRANPIAVSKSATVASGVAVFNLTVDGLSTGVSLFPNGVIKDSVSLTVSDATASYQMSYAFTNSDKTLTVTANKLTTANILTGILGQSAANTAVVKLSVFGY